MARPFASNPIYSLTRRDVLAWQAFLALCQCPRHDVTDGRKAAKIAFGLADAFLAEQDEQEHQGASNAPPPVH